MGNEPSAPDNTNANNSFWQNEAAADKASNPKANQSVNSKADALLSLLGNTFLTNDGSGDKTFAKGIAPNQIIGLYFSASWCPPCKQFTPFLGKLYSQWKRENQKIEIVFVSGDKDYDSFKAYFNDHHSNWLALPFGSQPIRTVNQQFQVRGIPTLIFLDSFGNVIDMDGRDLVSKQGANAINVLLNQMPEIKPKAFGGTGHSLKKDSGNGSGDQLSMYDYISPKELVIFDDSDECATMQVVLSEGTKKTVKMNMNKQNIGDLFAHVKFLNDCGAFKLLAGFPPKELRDETMSVKEAGLKGARVTQKKV